MKTKRTIQKILIANRGEIAVRIIRACRDLGIPSVAVYSDCDRTAYHVRMADEAYHIGPSPSSQSYLVQDKIIRVAKESGADAIHPGYGFLAENAEFAQRCDEEGIIFIGPRPDTIRLLGDKLQARRTAEKAGLAVIPGMQIEQNDYASIANAALSIGYPVLVKATAGGGGKGMRLVESENELKEALQSAGNEAVSSFGDGRLFLEKYLSKPRHIEMQILCDEHGNAIHLGERECSIQRRHQKVIEESPSPMMTDDLRRTMGEAAVAIAKMSGYTSAGTVEFLVDGKGAFYFLEVNTRLQVEHAVTEMITGIDLVKEQIAIAQGNALTFAQDDVILQGHAIECRIYAEDPTEGFLPSTGVLKIYRLPAGPGIRVDSGVVIFSEIPIYYDSMIAKLIVWGRTRAEAIRRMRRALTEYRISGVRTTIGFHLALLQNSRFLSGDISTHLLEDEYPDNQFYVLSEELASYAAIAVAVDALRRDRELAAPNGNSSQRSHSKWTLVHRRQQLEPFRRNR